MYSIPDAVAQFVTTVDIKDLTDSEFSYYEGSILAVCRKNKRSVHLAHEIRKKAEYCAINAEQLEKESERLAQRVHESAENEEGELRLCRICQTWQPLENFRRRKSGSYETACWPCEREEKRLYQAGRKRSRRRGEAVVE